MALTIKTAPSAEPLSLAQVKMHLRLDSESFPDVITTEISIAPGSHDIAAAYSLEGSSVEVSGYKVIVNLVAGPCGSGGTVDAKIQESDDDSDWTDVASGSFTQVTESNDNAVQEKEYTGSMRYIRVVATVAMAACEFGIEMILKTGETQENDLLTALIEAARQDCENFQNRKYITQTWELWLDEWPGGDKIEIPLPPLQEVSSIKYYDTDDTEATFSSDYYFVDTKSEPGRVVLNDGQSWPSTALRPANGICITFVCGYGDAGSDVPEYIKRAMLLLIGHLYENRETVLTTGMNVAELPIGTESLLWKERVM